MKIVYITNARFPTRKAYGVNVIKTCEALARHGAEVTLVAPSYKRDADKDGISCESSKKEFKTCAIRTSIDGVTWGRLGFWINRLVFALRAFYTEDIGKAGEKKILTRDELSGWFLRLLGYTVFYDLHGFPPQRKWFWAHMMRSMTGIIATSPAKADKCTRILGIPREKIVVAPNGFDPVLFDFKTGKEALRKELNLPDDRPIVMYAGHLYDWKGVFVLAETALQLPHAHFVFVGGMSWDIENFKKKYDGRDNISIIGYQPYQRIPLYLKAADVLVLPNSRVSHDKIFAAHSESDTSPIKLFEYMASGTPIVASDLPSIREVLNEKNACMVEPDNPKELKCGIENVLRDHSFADRVAQQAFTDSKNYTWEKRAEAIVRLLTYLSA